MSRSRFIAPVGVLAAVSLCVGSLGVLAQRSAVHAGFGGVEARIATSTVVPNAAPTAIVTRPPVAQPAVQVQRSNGDRTLTVSAATVSPTSHDARRLGLFPRD